MKLKKTVSSLVLSAAILGSGATAAFAATQNVGGNMELWNRWWFSLVKLLPRKQSSQIFSNRTILL
ncbi:hypothetical protein AAHB52_00645 [Bacillus toyonensis]